jgi:hypothetical protein
VTVLERRGAFTFACMAVLGTLTTATAIGSASAAEVPKELWDTRWCADRPGWGPRTHSPWPAGNYRRCRLVTDADDAFGIDASGREWFHDMTDETCKVLRVTSYDRGHFVVRARCKNDEESYVLHRWRLLNSGRQLEIRDAKDRALAVEMPKDFQGTWCTSSNTLKDDWHAYSAEGAVCSDANSVEITAMKVSIPAISVSCVVRQATKFDVCPYGMIFRNRERARVLRPFQINPWSPGYHIMLRCTTGSKQSETIGADWVIEKGGIRTGIARDYRCPWDRRRASTATNHEATTAMLTTAKIENV